MGFMDMKKKGKPLSDREIEAKTKVVEAMRDMAAAQMGDKLKGLKKVTVASNDPAGLKAGLEKAKELISKKPGDEDESMEDPTEEASETPEMEASEEKDENSHDMPMHSAMMTDDDSEEFAHMDEQELDEKLQELMAAKAKLSARK
jgi:hypothetical protein